MKEHDAGTTGRQILKVVVIALAVVGAIGMAVAGLFALWILVAFSWGGAQLG